MDASAVGVADAREAPREVTGSLAHDDFATVGQCAQPCCHVERGTAEGTVLQLDRLAGVDPDSDEQRELRVGVRMVSELPLELHGGSDCLARRVEDGQSLVAPDLDQRAAANLHPVLDEAAEPGR